MMDFTGTSALNAAAPVAGNQNGFLYTGQGAQLFQILIGLLIRDALWRHTTVFLEDMHHCLPHGDQHPLADLPG